jgi:hypothetical protein
VDPTELPKQWEPRTSFTVVNRPERVADHSPPSSDNVNNNNNNNNNNKHLLPLICPWCGAGLAQAV